MTIYFASLRLCVKFGSQSREDAKIIKDHICEKHSTTNLFCGMVLVTDSHNHLCNIANFQPEAQAIGIWITDNTTNITYCNNLCTNDFSKYINL